MSLLAERQRGFAAALLDPLLPVPAGLIDPNGKPSPKRFAVYRNNFVLGLTHALRDVFPVTHRIVGAEFFQAMTRAYVAIKPPRSPLLLDYGATFPEFIKGFGPVTVLPYLADVAHIERAWAEAYHAPEALPIDPGALAALSPDELPTIHLRLHPSTRLLRSQFPALTIWQMNVGEGVPAPVDLAAGGEDVLVVRPLADVEVRSISDGTFEFIQALHEGAPVLAATRAALTADRRFDLAANLSNLMLAGIVIGWDRERGSGT